MLSFNHLDRDDVNSFCRDSRQSVTLTTMLNMPCVNPADSPDVCSDDSEDQKHGNLLFSNVYNV